MTGYERQDEDFQPLTWFRGHPIYATYLLIIFHVFSLVAVTLFEVVANSRELTLLLRLSNYEVIHEFKLWQMATYALVHPLHINFVIEMALLLLYGRETERFLGRRVFLILYGTLLLTTPLVVLLVGAVTGQAMIFAGTFPLHFGIFVAFAVIYPSVQIFYGIPTKWIAWVLFCFYSLFFLSQSRANLALLPAFWSNALVAYFGVRYAGGGGGLEFLDRLKERFTRRRKISAPSSRLQPRRLVESNAAAGGKPSPARPVYNDGGELHESIDPLLDKISKHGLASLTHGERAALERARVSLLRKDRES